MRPRRACLPTRTKNLWFPQIGIAAEGQAVVHKWLKQLCHKFANIHAQLLVPMLSLRNLVPHQHANPPFSHLHLRPAVTLHCSKNSKRRRITSLIITQITVHLRKCDLHPQRTNPQQEKARHQLSLQEEENRRSGIFGQWTIVHLDWLPKLPRICKEKIQYRMVIHQMGLLQHQQSTHLRHTRQSKRRPQNPSFAQCQRTLGKHGLGGIVRAGVQGDGVQGVRNDDDGNNRQQGISPLGDEQHAATDQTGNHDPQRTGKLRKEDPGAQLLHAHQATHDQERRIMIFI